MTILLRDIPQLVDGAWMAPPDASQLKRSLQGVTTDSREVKEGDLFFAIRGETHDGHDFVDRALQAGASFACINANALEKVKCNHRVIVVPDTVTALQRLAAAHRRMLTRTHVIGVTGSNGKTTTCRLLHATLSPRLPSVRSRRSFNNHLGVPLTILKASPSDAILICELGANAPGEIDHLASILEPDSAVITSVGRAHIGGFGELDDIVREKAAIARHVRSGGVVYLPESPPEIRATVASFGRQSQIVGWSHDADVMIRSAHHVEIGRRLVSRIEMADGAMFEAPLLGRHNAVNIAFAVAVARARGLDDDAIREGLAVTAPPPMRFQRQTISGVDVFNDAYNANPDSMLASLETFLDVSRAASRRVVVFGDMLELGSHAAAAHRELISRALGDDRVDHLICVGPTMSAAAAEVVTIESRLLCESDPNDDAMKRIAQALRPDDAVLLKGSRRMRLERVVEVLAGETTAVGSRQTC